MDNDGVVKKSCALLIFLRDLDVFFLGTAMVFLLFLVDTRYRATALFSDYFKILQRTECKANRFFAA
jgi:hypothetical protein